MTKTRQKPTYHAPLWPPIYNPHNESILSVSDLIKQYQAGTLELFEFLEKLDTLVPQITD
jgi:hypothetical protein